MKSKFPLNRCVEVLWNDITSSNTPWLSVKDAIEDCNPIEVKTIGYVMHEDSKLLKLAMLQTSSNGGEVGVTCVIPKGTIIKMKVLKGL